MNEAKRIVGIDLGTTLSALAVIDQYGVPRIIPNAEGDKLTPSVVLFDDEGILVGQAALYKSLVEPDKVIRFVKREMSEQYVLYEYQDKRYYPEDISAEILKKLKQDAEAALGYPVQDAVISVPAYFDEARRRATRTAGERAGLNVVRLIAEPTAAALAFGIEQQSIDQTILVYDLGGGTFDATLMQIEGKKIRALAAEGEFELGGIDFDNQIIQYVVETFKDKYRFDPLEDVDAASELRERVEQAKKMLSLQQQVSILVRAKGSSLRVALTQDQFEAMIDHFLKASLMRVEMVLDAAGLNKTDIDNVVLVGGSTRIPLVRRMLHDFFGKPPLQSVNPDEAVALGAALAGGLELLEMEDLQVALPTKAAERLSSLTFSEVAPYSFGVKVLDNEGQNYVNQVLIPRNSPIPVSQVGHFQTTKEIINTEEGVLITVLQGELLDPNECQVLGEFVLKGLPPKHPKGSPIQVTYICNKDGIIEVQATDVKTNLHLRTTVNYKRGPSS